ncbi:unnamed protein product [Periconia digitata]|uniref:Uncharacterized protein n=1 Tax=Periconia digitata TaxID=1303443 RepID=A0A9W4UBG6_9PLEO|nr:unnamed protein product [Periconia digitata]
MISWVTDFLSYLTADARHPRHHRTTYLAKIFTPSIDYLLSAPSTSLTAISSTSNIVPPD